MIEMNITIQKERLAKIKMRLDQYYEAEMAVLSSQSYSIGGRSLTRANLGEIQTMIDTLEKKYDEIDGLIKTGGRRKAYRIVPRDL